jgi:hypothetical protein
MRRTAQGGGAVVLLVGAVAVLTLACPRPVWLAQAPEVLSLALEPSRSLSTVCPDGTLTGFAGDVIVITGRGWDPGASTARAGTTDLEIDSLTTEEIRARVPPDLGAGPVRVTVVSQGRSSKPSRQSLASAGPGHLERMSHQGVLEPVVTVASAGTGGTHCRPVEAPDGGVPVTAEDCAPYDVTSGFVSVAYALGAIVSGQAQILVATFHAFYPEANLAVLPAPSEGRRFVGAMVPFGAVRGGGVEVDTALMEGRWHADGGPAANTARLGLYAPEPGSTHQSRDLRDALLRRATDYFILVETRDGGHRLVPSGPGGLPLPVDQPGTPLAAGVLEPQWVPGATGRDPVLVTLAYDDTLDSLRLSRVPLPQPGPGAALVPTEEVHAGLPNRCEILDGAPCMAQDGTPHLTACCTPLLGFLGCWNDASCRSYLDGAPSVCTAIPSCLAMAEQALACASDPWCLNTVSCLLHDRCQHVGACLGMLFRAAYSDRVVKLVPWQEGRALLVPPPLESPLDSPASPVCVLNLEDGFITPYSELGVPVLTATTSPRADPQDSVLAMVPIVGQPRREVWTYSAREGLVRTPARTDYVSLHADPTFRNLYAIPRAGGRVDVLDLQGRLTDTVSVLGSPLDAWLVPAAGDRACAGEGGGPPEDVAEVVVVYPQVVLRVDVSGAPRGDAVLVSTPALPVLEEEPGVPPPAFWTADAEGTGDGEGWRLTKVRRIQVTPERFGQPTRVITITGAPDATGATLDARFFPVARHGERLFLQEEETSTIDPQGVAQGSARVGWVETGQAAPDSQAVQVVPGIAYGFVMAVDPVLNRLYFVNIAGGGLDPSSISTGVLDLSATPPAVMGAPAGTLPACISMVVLPGRGVLGLFFDPLSWEVELGHVDATLRYRRVGDAPAVQAALALSPDGRRVYAGVEGSILELAITEEADGLGAHVVSQTPVQATPHVVRVDPTGRRLVYTDASRQVVGRVE